jgi:hypothetical protein
MPKRVAVCISLNIALLAVPGGALAAEVVKPSSVTADVVVPAGGTSTVRLECPSPAVALSGAVRQMGPAVTLRRSTPGLGANDWRFRLAADGTGGRRVSAVLRCVRLAVPAGLSGTRLDVKTRSRPSVVIPAGGTAAAQVRCGPAWLATGYGLEAGTSGSVRVASAVPVAHGWDFVLENVGAAPVTAGVSARCLRQTVRSGGAELRFRASRPSRRNTLGTRRSPAFAHGCGAGRFSLATGVILDPLDTIELAASGPVRRAWGRWAFRQASGGDSVRTFLVCLRTDSAFN